MTNEKRELGGQKESGGRSAAIQSSYENTKANKRKVGIKTGKKIKDGFRGK